MTAERKPPRVSFEFFPPKTEEMEEILWRSLKRLEPLDPAFVSVTYGAGGSTRTRTHNTVRRVLNETGLTPAAHLTCVNATREEVDDVIRDYWQAGVRHIVALRGDPPEGIGAAYRPHPGGYANAAELAAGISRIADFEISVGCYPEKHPESPSYEADIDLLKQKIDAGASRAITQFFFEPEMFLRFRDRLARAGVTIPIVPGIMPVLNFRTLSRMAGACGATLPDWLAEKFEGLEEDPGTRKLVAATVAADLCTRLQAEGVNQFHFYTLNRADLTYAICHLLGLRPARNGGGAAAAAQ
ncbi:MAG: methylenetetrahydrofolate reductase [NAD(P)H] [Alphaproteobacteria bacterium]